MVLNLELLRETAGFFMTDARHGYQNEIVLIRGLPGSGKSTLAKKMEGHVHLEADMFFVVDGLYRYDASKVRAAHDWCVAEAKKTLEGGSNVVVSNTFVKVWELQRYVDLGFPFRVVEMRGLWPNIHGVPEERIQLMTQQWQTLPKHFRGPEHLRTHILR